MSSIVYDGPDWIASMQKSATGLDISDTSLKAHGLDASGANAPIVEPAAARTPFPSKRRTIEAPTPSAGQLGLF